MSRSIGDRCERPFVSSAVDITHNLIDEELDSFVVIASDGLFDVMTSQDVVSFIHQQVVTTPPHNHQFLQKNIGKIVADEALKRGSFDNITVLVLWINRRY